MTNAHRSGCPINLSLEVFGGRRHFRELFMPYPVQVDVPDVVCEPPDVLVHRLYALLLALCPEEIKPLSAEQAKALLAAVEGDRLEGIYVLALTTGARIGELLALRWSDLEADTGSRAGTLRIERTRTGAKSGPRFTTPISSPCSNTPVCPAPSDSTILGTAPRRSSWVRAYIRSSSKNCSPTPR